MRGYRSLQHEGDGHFNGVENLDLEKLQRGQARWYHWKVGLEALWLIPKDKQQENSYCKLHLSCHLGLMWSREAKWEWRASLDSQCGVIVTY